MEKNEILRKAQAEHNDEMELQIRDKSIKWTYITMVAAAAIFSFIRSEQGLPSMDLCATVSFSVCIGQFYRYAKTKERACFIIAGIMFIISILATARFFMGH